MLLPRVTGENWYDVERDPPGLSPSWLSFPNLKNHMSTTLGLVSELERIAGAVGTEDAEAPQVSLPAVAEKIARIMGVRKEEVAILAVSTRWKHLHFLVPEALKNVGFIPLNST